MLRLSGEAGHGLMDGRAVLWQHLDPLEFQQAFNPVLRPGHFRGTLVNALERREAKAVFSGNLIVIAARGLTQRQQRIALIKGENPRTFIAPELRRDGGQQR